MALLHCRDCGAEISSDTRLTKCKQCGTLFPFACQACGKPLRPPFAVYSDERHLTKANEPLCDEHYERQCPGCKSWFRADENPGFFMCTACTARRSAGEPVGVVATKDDDEDDDPPPRRRRAGNSKNTGARKTTGSAKGGKGKLGCMVIGPFLLCTALLVPWLVALLA